MLSVAVKAKPNMDRLVVGDWHSLPTRLLAISAQEQGECQEEKAQWPFQPNSK